MLQLDQEDENHLLLTAFPSHKDALLHLRYQAVAGILRVIYISKGIDPELTE
jgi:hypothetical protein